MERRTARSGGDAGRWSAQGPRRALDTGAEGQFGDARPALRDLAAARLGLRAVDREDAFLRDVPAAQEQTDDRQERRGVQRHLDDARVAGDDVRHRQRDHEGGAGGHEHAAEDDINRGHFTGPPRGRATEQSLSGLHRRGRFVELAQRRDAARDDDRPFVGAGVAELVGRRDPQRVRAIVQVLRLEGPGARLRAALVARLGFRVLGLVEHGAVLVDELEVDRVDARALVVRFGRGLELRHVRVDQRRAVSGSGTRAGALRSIRSIHVRESRRCRRVGGGVADRVMPSGSRPVSENAKPPAGSATRSPVQSAS